MEDKIEITPTGELSASIRPPGSKSITNRAMICAALADGQSRLRGVLDSEDTQVMIGALRALGLDIEHDQHEATATITGGAGKAPCGQSDLFVANSGTTIRFLTAMLASAGGRHRLDGVARMRERPIEDLLEAIRQLGGDARSENGDGCPPVQIDTTGLRGGTAQVRGNISSQFLSGLLLAAPNAQSDVELIVDGPLVSQPYIEITLQVMKAFGATIARRGYEQFSVPAPQAYRACDYEIEPDASAASYFWAAAAIAGGEVTVQGLTQRALQGDVAFCDCLRQMGCQVRYGEQSTTVQGGPLRGVEVDMNAISDTVQTLAAVALFADGPTTIRGVAHIRHKETDRIGDLARELRKLGADVQEYDDGLTIRPVELRSAEIETYHDHRMAMSLALVGLKVPGVVILNPACSEKTYPRFFEDLASVVAAN